ncbi:MAG: amino acid adenylation domain-containing protein [Candidatus Aminicenantes bacterium]|nr:amino acid adenylation domain-containing protein [Candidatus Aminicenantes bacterium]
MPSNLRVGSKEPVAIIGMAGIFPGSQTVQEFFHNTLRKRCFVRELPDWVWEQDVFFSSDRSASMRSYSRIGAMLGEFDVDLSSFRIPPAVAEGMSLDQKLALVCARETLRDAGYLNREFNRERTGVIVAAAGGHTASLDGIAEKRFRKRIEKLAKDENRKRWLAELWEAYDKAYPRAPITEDSLPGELGSLVSGRIASVFDLHGPNFILDSACASSLAAAATSVTVLRAGLCDMVLTGGVDTDMGAGTYVALSKVKALSAKGSFPFDQRADGFVLGEGCGFFLLKRYQDAVRDGDRIYALILGAGSSSDGAGKDIMAPSSEGQSKAFHRAYAEAGVGPEVLHYLECHGTGTAVGDEVELTSLNRLILSPPLGKPRRCSLPIGSGKAMVGHLKLAAGSIGLFRAILAVNSRIVPPQCHFEIPNPAFDWEKSRLHIPKLPEPINENKVYTGVSGFGFGGTNVHLVLSSPASNSRQPVVSTEDYIFPKLPEIDNDIAFMFPGQGSQYVGMLEELREEPETERFLSLADKIVMEITGRTISDKMYPPLSLRQKDKNLEKLEAELRRTSTAQPALFVASAILLEKLRRLGINCAMTFGLSLGESTAIYAAGMLGFEDALRAVAKRGQLMETIPLEDAGAMAFVNAGYFQVEKWIREIDGYIICANLNSYSQTVVSGEKSSVDALISMATEKGFQAGHLNVDRAFHSVLTSPCSSPLRKFLEKLPFKATKIPVPANISRQIHPYVTDDFASGKVMETENLQRVLDLQCRIIDHPTDFISQVELAYEAGIRRFVEVGPRNVLAGLVSDILQGKAFQTIYLDHRGKIRKQLDKLQENLRAPLKMRRRPLSSRLRASSAKPLEAADSVEIKTPYERVRFAVSRVTGYKPEQIEDDAEFERDLGINTLKIFEIITRLRGNVLPRDFSRFREATSIRKILDIAAVDNLGNVSGSTERYSGIKEGEVVCYQRRSCFSDIKISPEDLRNMGLYRIFEGPGPAIRETTLSYFRFIRNENSRKALVILRLPAEPEELCFEIIPRLVRLVINITDSFGHSGKNPVVHLVTLSKPEHFRSAFFQSLNALVKSFQKDLRSILFYYSHLDSLHPDRAMLSKALVKPVLGRHVHQDGRIDDGRLVRVLIPQENFEDISPFFSDEDVVLVTGGARGIASSIVRALLPYVKARFLLIGRKTKEERWISEEGKGRVWYIAADLCDKDAIRKIDLPRQKITFIFHAAGLSAARPIREIQEEELIRILSVKILGLHRILDGCDLSRLRGIVNFSSIAGFFGGDGHPDYAAANGYLNGFSIKSVPVLSIGWSAWDEVGMATGDTTKEFLKYAGIKPIPLSRGIEVFMGLLTNFLKSTESVTQNVMVSAGMGEGFFLHSDPFSPGKTSGPHGKELRNKEGFQILESGELSGFLDRGRQIDFSQFLTPVDSIMVPENTGILVLNLQSAAALGKSDLSIYTPAEQKEMLKTNLDKRRDEKLAGKLAVKLLVREAMKRWFDETFSLNNIEVLTENFPLKIRISPEDYGHPPESALYFSISHSEKRVCAAISLSPIGIDVEDIRPLSSKVVKAICGPRLDDWMSEYRKLHESRERLSVHEVKQVVPLIMFAQKESVLKAAGIGLARGLSDVVISDLALKHPVTASYHNFHYRVFSTVDNGSVFSMAQPDEEPCKPLKPSTAERKTVEPSIGQEALWFLDQMEDVGSTYHVVWSQHLKGQLDVPAIERSLNTMVERHEALRTVFFAKNGRCSAEVLSIEQVPFFQIDLTSMGIREKTERLEELTRMEIERPFILSKGPLFRVVLFCLQDRDHLLLFVFHHIIMDSFSALAFRQELARCYKAYSTGEKPRLQPLPFQYADRAKEQRRCLTSKGTEKLIEFWKRKLADIPPLSTLPTDRRRPHVQTFRAQNVSFFIPPGLLKALRELSKKEGVTLFVTFLAAFQFLLSRLSGLDDIVVGSPFLGRSDLKSYPVFGYFVNILPIRTVFSGNPGFRDILPKLRMEVLEALEHQGLPFSKIVEAISPERFTGYPPIFQIVFRLLQENTKGVNLPGLGQEIREIPAGGIAYDLCLMMNLNEKDGNGRFEYNSDLFDEATVQRISERFLRFLEAVAADPEKPLADISLMSTLEKNLVLKEWNKTQVPIPDMPVHVLFSRQADRTPDATAIVTGKKRLSYRELNEKANKLAAYLKKKQCGENVLTGVFLERSVEMVIAFIAILKAGGAYVPLDPNDPMERLAFMIEDTGMNLLLTRKSLLGRIPVSEVTKICLDREWPAFEKENKNNPVNLTEGKDPVYVMYTSGSTGTPKGVLVPHRAVVRLFFGANYARLDPSKTILHMAPASFDASTFELWGALLHGSRCILYPDRIPTITELEGILKKYKVTTLWLTASLFNILVDEKPDILNGVEQVLTGGEILSIPHVRRALEFLPGTQVINCYGPTETATFATFYPVPRTIDKNIQSIPIGRPVGNTKIYLLDGLGNPVPIGCPGEIHIGGLAPALGYLNRRRQTEECFIPDRFHQKPGASMYKTGDIARFLPDGNIEFHGRNDSQVKIRGFRVEPGEIEAELRRFPAVKDAAVLAKKSLPYGQTLVAFVIPERDTSIHATDLKTFLGRRLPDYMIPEKFFWIEKFPMTKSGKMDRQTLLSVKGFVPDRKIPDGKPINNLENKLLRIWEDIFRKKNIGPDENFFDLGGHSLLAVTLVEKIRREFGKDIPLSAVFEAPTVMKLAQFLHSRRRRIISSPLIPVKTRGSKKPFFGIHMPYQIKNYLHPEQPYFILRYNDLSLNRNEDIAARYLEEMLRIQPEGPYYFGGFSFGGLVALEVAHQLQARGLPIGYLVLAAPTPLKALSLSKTGRNNPFAFMKKSLVFTTLRFPGFSMKRKLRLMVSIGKEKTTRSFLWAMYKTKIIGETGLSIRMKKMITPKILGKYAVEYVPRTYEGPVTFISENGLESLEDWSKVLVGPVDEYRLSVHHSALHQEPFLGCWAEFMCRGLSQALEKG